MKLQLDLDMWVMPTIVIFGIVAGICGYFWGIDDIRIQTQHAYRQGVNDTIAECKEHPWKYTTDISVGDYVQGTPRYNRWFGNISGIVYKKEGDMCKVVLSNGDKDIISEDWLMKVG